MTVRSCHDPALLSLFGVPGLRPAQTSAFEALAAGRDVLVVMPTGGGKSLCYQFPAAAGLAPAIVVSPLVALMKDQVDALRRKGVPAARLSSVDTPAERENVWNEFDAKRLAMLYVAPEALESPRTARRLAAATPRLLAIDEAHCISEWGESFRPSYLRLGELRHTLGHPPTIALTATATPRTRRDIVQRLGLNDPLTIVSGFDRPNLFFGVERLASELDRENRLIALVGRGHDAAVVYATTRRETERVASLLRRRGIGARAYHAGLPSAERATVQDDFLVNRVRVIVATCAFGMGVDKPDVRLVVHVALPPSLEAYYQEAGRAGRDGAPGDCILLRAPGDDRVSLARFAASPPDLAQLAAISALARRAERSGSPLTTDADTVARVLMMDRRQAQAALRILLDANAIEVIQRRTGTLRMIALFERVSTDSSLASDDVSFARKALSTFGPDLYDGKLIDRCDLRALDPSGAAPARLERLASRQILLWTPQPDVFAYRGAPGDSLALHLRRFTLRQQRDAWRFDMVRRFVDTTRCRRLVMLRYFGDRSSSATCGRCDVCATGGT